MDRVKVVVEKKIGQRPAACDDHAAPWHFLMGAMFQERANFQQRQPEIGRDHIEPQRHRRDLNRIDHRHQPDKMQHIAARRLGSFCGNIARVAAVEPDERDGRPHQHPSQKQVVEPVDHLQNSGRFGPGLRIHVVAFRVVVRVGQVRVIVVLQMRFAEPAIRNEETHGRKYQRLAPPFRPERMAMQHLVLK